MKKLLISCCLYVGCAVQAETLWFNIMGDPDNDKVDTVEVDPRPVSVQGSTRTMRVRVSRAQERLNWDGLAYRSYTSEVFFDCLSHTTRYLLVNYYTQPAWRGQAYKSVTYSPRDVRTMELRDISPNPQKRIVRAACHSSS